MSYQDKHEIIFRPGIMGDQSESLGKVRFRGLVPGQGINMRAVAGILEQFIQVLRVRRKPLVVVWFAAKSRGRDVVDTRMRGQCGNQGAQQAAAQQCESHTTPHLRRSSHSADMSSSNSRNTTGMFHSSLMSRTEMPASE